MSKVTDALDRVAQQVRPQERVFSVASSDADEKQTWEEALRSGASMESLIEAKGPPRLVLRRENDASACSVHYRGYQCWISGSKGAKEALEVLEEFSLADMDADARWRTVQAAVDLSLELREPEAPTLSLEEQAERVEKRAESAKVRQAKVASAGAALLDTSVAAVWCAGPVSALIIDGGGTFAFAGWSMRPVQTVVRWVDEGEAIDTSAAL